MKRQSRQWSGLAIDRLETRRVLSLAPWMVAGASPAPDALAFSGPQLAVTPADGSAFRADDVPAELLFHMGGPAAFLWAERSIELRRVEGDGAETTIVDVKRWGAARFDGDAVALALPSKLEAGRYRIVVVAGSGLAATYSQGRWDPMADHAIAEFVVQAKPAVAATDLGVVGPRVLAAAGALDGPSGGSDSYRIHLAEGTALWRLTLQVDAGRIGSGLSSGLSIHDSSGRQVASAPAGSGFLGDYPDDPYLFAGLAPGDYVVVVSKAAGTPGGAYRLNLAAIPAAATTRVSSFVLDRAEAGAPGFTIAFTSPIDPARLRSDAVRVVDAAGAVHAVRLESVNAGLTAARFRFVAPLPAGTYRLEAAGERPLTDLIGRVPVAAGQPAGTLARWTVSAAEAGAAEPIRDAVASGPLGVAPGESLELPITLGADESLVLETWLTSGGLRAELIGGGEGPLVVAEARTPGLLQSWLRPGAGSFTLRITAIGGEASVGGFTLTRAPVSEASLVARAVGSGGAIEIGLGEGTTPSAPGGTVAPSGPAAPGATATAGGSRGGGMTSGPTVAATATGRTEMGPSPWARSAGSGPIGRPSPTGDAVAPVGPATADGPTSVAWAGDAGSPSWRSLVLSERRDADVPAPRPDPVEVADATPARDDRIARATAERADDDDALERAERVADAFLGRLRWVFERSTGAEEAPAEAADAVALARAESADPGDDAEGSDGKVQRSALDLPFAALFVTASTYHLRRATRRWWRRRKAQPHPTAGSGRPSTPKPLFRGPRLMTPGRTSPRMAGPRRG